MNRSQSGQGRKDKAKLLTVAPRSKTTAARESFLGAPKSPPQQAKLELALVNNLRKQVACLEMEVAVLKRGSQLSADKMSERRLPSASSSHVDPTTVSLDADMNQERQQHSLYRVDAASLQLIVQRLCLEKEVLEEQLRCERQKKEKIMEENAKLILELRATNAKEEIEKRLHSEAITALNTLQRKNRELEDKLRAIPTPCKNEVGETFNKDLLSENEYYRLQTDRLRVAQQESIVCIEELEKQLKEERARSESMELKLSVALQKVETLQLAIAKRGNVYECLDQSYVKMCTLLRIAVDDCDKLRERLHQFQARASSPRSSISIDEALGRLENVSFGVRKDVCSQVGDGSDKDAPEENMLELPEKTVENASFSAPPTASIPAPPTASIPAPPTASIPAPPTASIPAPPTASIPAPPTASIPAPPTASIPAPPTPGQHGGNGEFLHNAIYEELEAVERRIREEEEALLAYLKAQ